MTRAKTRETKGKGRGAKGRGNRATRGNKCKEKGWQRQRQGKPRAKGRGAKAKSNRGNKGKDKGQQKQRKGATKAKKRGDKGKDKGHQRQRQGPPRERALYFGRSLMVPINVYLIVTHNQLTLQYNEVPLNFFQFSPSPIK